MHRPVRLFAPAKVNLGLEITGRRSDGYHDVVSVLESISIFDVIDILPSSKTSVVTTTGVPEQDNLVTRALAEVERMCGVGLGHQIRIQKRIPEAAGLGGGSSDAGVVLAWLQMTHHLNQVATFSIAASLGTDVPFFLKCGTALARWTGTQLSPLAVRGRRWYVILVPDLQIPGKTGELYRQLTTNDFSDGRATLDAAQQLMVGAPVTSLTLRNGFERPLMEYAPVRKAFASLRNAGAGVILPSGAGPSLFAVYDTYSEAARIARDIPSDAGDVHLATNISCAPWIQQP